MRKAAAWLLLVLLLMTSVCASADQAYLMAGYDGEGINHDWDSNLFFQRMEEKTGVSFVFQQANDYQAWSQQKQAYLNGTEEMPDVLFKAELTAQETMELMAQGKIIDLKPYLQEHAPNLWALLEQHPDWMKAITLPTGEIAALPSINELQNTNAMWINRTWLENLGLKTPTNAQELTEVLRAFRDQDANRNGKDDEIPLTFVGMWDLKWLGHAFGLVANDYNVYVDENGQVQTNLTSDENRAFLAWLNQLWKEELLDGSGFNTSDTMRAITEKDAPITFGVMLAPTPLSLVPSAALPQYELLMPMEYNGKQVYRQLTNDLFRGAFAISAGCAEPEKILAWVDFLYTEEGCRLAQAGMENEEYVWNDDGTWTWLADEETVANTVLAEATIAEGGATPGLSSAAFQRAYDETETHRAIVAIEELKKVSIMPYPLVYLAREELSRLNALQADVGYYAEKTMAWFVTGDLPLDDDNWNSFAVTLKEKGMDDVIAILQSAIK